MSDRTVSIDEATSDGTVTLPDSHPASGRFLPALLLLFFGSGAAALIYEIVWFQLLQLVIGSSAVSIAVLLGTYMGGMCLGSLLFSRVVPPRRHPLRVYALIEAGIGFCGLLVPLVLPLLARFYLLNAGHGFGGILFRGLVCALCLLAPTMLMGATLPAISRWVEATPRGVSWLGFFYGGNIAGAVFGCLLAGFYLLRVHDMPTATFVAAALNASVALVGFTLSTEHTKSEIRNPKSEIRISSSEILPHPKGAPWVYVTIALSGLTALSAEVIWTRILSLLLGATVYTFSIILAMFLVGLGIGSAIGSWAARNSRQPRFALALCQFLLAAGIAWTAWMLAKSLPYWPVNPSLARSAWFNFQLDLTRCLWALLPPALLWGASFPLALAAVVAEGCDPGRIVGRLYAANTVGAIVGAVGTSLLMISRVGTQHAQQIIVGIAAFASLMMIFSLMCRPAPATSAPPAGDHEHAGGRNRFPLPGINPFAGCAMVLIAGGLTAVLVRTLPAIPWQLVAHGRYLPTYGDDRRILFVGEGINASVAVTETYDGVRNFHISGKVEASTDSRDMRLQRMLGHIPALLHANPRSVLVVGCGAGVTAGSFLTYPGVERVVICEIEPLIPSKIAPYFKKQNYNVVNDPRVQIVYDDARHYVLTTKDKFDIITSDPIHPWVKGAATLYTREYFEICRQHLNPGGLVTQWVPLYESSSSVVRSELATFFDVFPDGTIWSNDDNGAGYDTVVLGSADPVKINVDQIEEKLQKQVGVAASLSDVGFHTTLALLATYAGEGRDLAPWLKHAEINRDRNLRLQYLAGMAANVYEEGPILEDMLAYRRFPEKLFSGSDENLTALKILMVRSNAVK